MKSRKTQKAKTKIIISSHNNQNPQLNQTGKKNITVRANYLRRNKDHNNRVIIIKIR